MKRYIIMTIITIIIIIIIIIIFNREYGGSFKSLVSYVFLDWAVENWRPMLVQNLVISVQNYTEGENNDFLQWLREPAKS